jgi:hypothetical protein
MHRAGLAEETASEPLQYAIGLDENAPAPVGGGCVVGSMLAIIGERDGGYDFDRPAPPECEVETERSQRRQVFRVEVRHRARCQREPPHRAVIGAHRERVIEKIDIDREGPVAIGHGRGGEAARRHIERDLPPMVLHGRQCQPRLADDLQPHVERRIGILPLAERQRGPRRIFRGGIHDASGAGSITTSST